MKGIEGPQVAENISKAKMREILKNVAPKLNNFGQIAKQGENLRTDAAIYPIKGKYSAHSSRVTVISNLLEKDGVSVHEVAEFIGHKNVNTTHNYNKRSRKLKNNLAFDINY